MGTLPLLFNRISLDGSFLYAFQYLKIGEGILPIIIIIIATIASHVVWNIAWVANMSMINVAGKNPEERMELTSTRAAYNSLSRVLFSYIGPGVVAALAGLLGEKNSYAAAAFCFAFLMAVLYFAHFKMFEGYEDVASEMAESADKKQKKQTASGLAKSLFGNPSLLFLLIAELAKFLYNFVSSGIAIYYFTYVSKNDGLLAVYILISNLLGIAGSYLSKWFAKKITARNTIIMSYFFMIISLIIGFLFYKNTYIVIGCTSIAQFLCALTNACDVELFANCAVYSEWKTGQNATGWVMGLINLPLKVGVVCRGICISACLAAASFDNSIDPAQASEVLMRNISIGYMIVPAIALVVGLLLMVFGYRITRDKAIQYQAEIDARKQPAH